MWLIATTSRAVECGECENEFALEVAVDADNQRSVIICDCCRGAGHVRRVCPSAKRFRSFRYVIALLESARARTEAGGCKQHTNVGGRQPPPRGQRPSLPSTASALPSKSATGDSIR